MFTLAPARARQPRKPWGSQRADSAAVGMAGAKLLFRMALLASGDFVIIS
jgi:hypothetical protein